MPQIELQVQSASLVPASPSQAPASGDDAGHDETAAAAAAALSLVRRALIEGAPVTREALGREASFMLGSSPQEALRALDATAQRLGLASLL